MVVFILLSVAVRKVLETVASLLKLYFLDILHVNQKLLVAHPDLDKRLSSRVRQCTSRSNTYRNEKLFDSVHWAEGGWERRLIKMINLLNYLRLK